MEEQRTEFQATSDSNRKELIESQRLLFSEQGKLIKNKLADITRLMKEVEDLCKANRERINEQSNLLIDCCMRIAHFEKTREALMHKYYVLFDKITNLEKAFSKWGK